VDTAVAQLRSFEGMLYSAGTDSSIARILAAEGIFGGVGFQGSSAYAEVV
jgi:hypothetical protein